MNNNKFLINTNLDTFIFINKIISIDNTNIIGTAENKTSDLLVLLETMAQFGAMHVRYLINFEKHAFLIKIKDLFISDIIFKGKVQVNGKCVAKSDISFKYYLTVQTIDNKQIASGYYLFSTQKYGSEFKSEKIKKHYQDLFLCLQKNLKKI